MKTTPTNITQSWSKDRPVKPAVDPLYLELVDLIEKDPRSTWAKANVSGLSPATISNWTMRRVKHPQASSLQLAARMLGYDIGLIPRRAS